MTSWPNPCFIADDLSGALEVGGVFHAAGQSVRLIIDPSSRAQRPPDRILGYDLNTRQTSPDRAYRIVRDLVEGIRSRRSHLLYKKVDSTLRGWIAEEIRAVLDAEPDGIVLFCPANPAVGRTIRGGRLLVDGVPVDETAFNRDPAFPITKANLEDHFPPDLRNLLRHCPLATVRAPETALSTWIDQALLAGARILSVDAATEGDLAVIVRAGETIERPILLCGSGALAGAIHRAGKPTSSPLPAEVSPPIPSTAAGVCFLIGSAHPRTREQLDLLIRDRPIDLLPFDADRPESWDRPIDEFRSKQDQRPVAVVPRTSGRSRQETASAIQLFYRRLVEQQTAERFPRRLFVTGGETARTLSETAGIEHLDLIGNLEPGVAVSVAGQSATGTGETRPFTLVTKPGGFGGPETLVHSFDYLTS